MTMNALLKRVKKNCWSCGQEFDALPLAFHTICPTCSEEMED